MGAHRRAVVAGVLLLLAVLAVLLVRGASDSPAEGLAQRGLQVGLIPNALDGGPGELDAARDLGVGWVREEVRWQEVEPRRGRRDWSAPDRLFAEAARRGVRVLPLLLGTPRWQAADPLSYPTDLAAWGRWAGDVVARYGPGGRFWQANPRLRGSLAPTAVEVWNEPWFPFFSGGRPSPARYAAMYLAAARAGDRANPRVQMLLAGEGPYTAPDGSVRDWMADLLAAEPALGAAIDATSVHPYAVGSPLREDQDPRARFDRIDGVLERLRAARAPTRLWITEIGWSSCAKRPDCVSELEQAANLRRVFTLVRERYAEQVEAVFVYHLRNFGPRVSPRDVQAFYGLLRVDGSRKPAWAVVRSAARSARGA